MTKTLDGSPGQTVPSPKGYCSMPNESSSFCLKIFCQVIANISVTWRAQRDELKDQDFLELNFTDSELGTWHGFNNFLQDYILEYRNTKFPFKPKDLGTCK